METDLRKFTIDLTMVATCLLFATANVLWLLLGWDFDAWAFAIGVAVLPAIRVARNLLQVLREVRQWDEEAWRAYREMDR